MQSALGIPVEDQEFASRFKWKCFSQLLHDPQTGRVLGDIEMYNATTVVGDDEETVEHPKTDCRHSEEIHRSDSFSMISKKGEPALSWFRTSRRSSHPAGDSPFGNIKTQHEKLTMDAWCAPSRILSDHAQNQISDFLRCWFSPNAISHPREELPIELEASSMPADNCLGSDDNECLLPLGPQASSENPEEFVKRSKSGLGMLALGMLALENSQLLSQC